MEEKTGARFSESQRHLQLLRVGHGMESEITSFTRKSRTW